MPPICVKCQIEMRCKKNGTIAVPMAIHGPISLRRCDMFACPECGTEVLTSFAPQPELSSFEPSFQSRLDSYEMDGRERVVRYFLNQREKKQYCESRIADKLKFAMYPLQ